ncbi:MAG: DNA/RNA non-specific endonuclease [Gammaproteobacteria bacterium]|nr:DNA/RNA non-specific endonuclease [Gammaproteobacteria bacterium]
MKAFALLVTALVSLNSYSVSSQHCSEGCPTGTPSSNWHIWRNAYTLSNNATTKFADWVAYTVTKSTINGSRSRNWQADPDIWSSRTLEPSDHTNAHATIGTDRGHQAPLASLSGTSDWYTLNYLSNITPQRSALNQGPWNYLEGRVRNLAQRYDVSEVHVVTGPLYEYYFASLPNADESHRIPSGYWKVIYVNNGSIQTAAFIFDQNTSRSANYCNYQVSIDQVESRSGLNILPYMSNQSTIERRTGWLRDDLGC